MNLFHTRGGGSISLQEIVMEKVVHDILSGFYCLSTSKESSKLTKTVHLPLVLSQKVFNHVIQNGLETTSKKFNRILLSVFEDSSKMPLDKICIQYTNNITPSTLAILIKANPWIIDLDIRDCQLDITQSLWSAINSCTCLKSLKIDNMYGVLRCPSLETLVVWNNNSTGLRIRKLYNTLTSRRLDKYLTPVIKNLKYLDLSGTEYETIRCLKNATKLETLILHNVNVDRLIDDILELKKLRGLHISVSAHRRYYMSDLDPNSLLQKIIKSLPNLTHLDISGTNLSGNEGLTHSGFHQSLASRTNNPLQFLGLLGMDNNAFPPESLPALEIAGTANESQLMTALERYFYRPDMLLLALYYMKRSDVKALTVPEIQRRMDLFCQILNRPTTQLRKHLILNHLTMKCLQKLLVSEPKIDNLNEYTRDIVYSIFSIIHFSQSNPLIIDLANDIFVMLDPLSLFKYDFKKYAQILMKVNSDLLTIKSSSKLCRLRAMLTYKITKEYGDYLCDLQIIDASLAYLQSLHWKAHNFQVEDILPIILVVWRTISNVVVVSKKAVEKFMQLSGFKWLYWYLCWYPKNPELQRILGEITNKIASCPEFFELKSSIIKTNSPGGRREQAKKKIRKNNKILQLIRKNILGMETEGIRRIENVP